MVKIEWLKLCQFDWANNNIYKHMLRSKYVAYHNPSFSLTTEGIEYKEEPKHKFTLPCEKESLWECKKSPRLRLVHSHF